MRAFAPSCLLLSSPLHRLLKGVAGFGCAALVALGAAIAPIASAQPANGSTGFDSTGDSKSEMAACQSGRSPQDRATCIDEVRRAQAARRAGRLENYGEQFAANALKRCEIFKGNEEEMAACRIRVLEGRIDGSVAEGGILREAVITTVTVPSAPPQAQ